MQFYYFIPAGIAVFILILYLFSGSNLAGFLQFFGARGAEVVSVSTNATIYRYGDTIHLVVQDYNPAFLPIDISDRDMKPYAGLPEYCGDKPYLTFMMFPGDYSKNITNYDQLFSLRGVALNVVNKNPGLGVDCPILEEPIRSVLIYGNSNHATITTSPATGNSDKPTSSAERNLIEQLNIQKSYPKDIVTNPNYRYANNTAVEGQLLPIGKYTIVGFTLSGQISKPLVIDIVRQ
jgi:hypothetical protein